MRTLGVREYCVRCKVFPNAASTPSFTSQGGVASVALSATGKFTVTLSDPYYSLVSFQTTYTDTSDSVDLYAQGGDVSNLASATQAAVTAVVKLKTGSSNTNAGATDANRYISVDLVFEDSSV